MAIKKSPVPENPLFRAIAAGAANIYYPIPYTPISTDTGYTERKSGRIIHGTN
jgi:hypothetical protein